MRVNLIYARASNGVIGHTVAGVGAMPWHLPEDLAHFRRLTQGCPVIMGGHVGLAASAFPPAAHHPTAHTRG